MLWRSIIPQDENRYEGIISKENAIIIACAQDVIDKNREEKQSGVNENSYLVLVLTNKYNLKIDSCDPAIP